MTIKAIYFLLSSTTQIDQGLQSFQQIYFLGHPSYFWGDQESYLPEPVNPLIYKGFTFKYLFK